MKPTLNERVSEFHQKHKCEPCDGFGFTVPVPGLPFLTRCTPCDGTGLVNVKKDNECLLLPVTQPQHLPAFPLDPALVAKNAYSLPQKTESSGS